MKFLKTVLSKDMEDMDSNEGAESVEQCNGRPLIPIATVYFYEMNWNLELNSDFNNSLYRSGYFRLNESDGLI